MFTQFLSDDILKIITAETNKYAENYIRSKKLSGKMMKKSRDLIWEETNCREIKFL